MISKVALFFTIEIYFNVQEKEKKRQQLNVSKVKEKQKKKHEHVMMKANEARRKAEVVPKQSQGTLKCHT